ncbi:MAG: PilT/PilU family type 4a pilus ATPase [Lentisphaerales bacterium]|nr:PilT/PilU family type 4a pilus ATPase [Lentisphaerales bacterium]
MNISEKLMELLEICIEKKVSDLHISVNTEPLGRIHGALTPLTDLVWNEEQMQALINACLDENEKNEFNTKFSLDTACSVGKTRFRINIYRERGYSAWAIRRLEDKICTVEELDLPAEMLDFAKMKDGLVLFTGPTGSGKSTSLATLLNFINENRSCHILTIEDPIEYLHVNKKSLVHQREIGTDVTTFANSLREALREDPDVILVGEMRDLDTIRAALTAAETGHLVFSTLHCADTVGALDRILSMYPAEEQEAIRRQLAMTLKGVIAQRLLPRRAVKGRVAAVEILKINNAVANLVRTAQFNQIYNILETSSGKGMKGFDTALAKLVYDGLLEESKALTVVRNKALFFDKLALLQTPPEQSGTEEVKTTASGFFNKMRPS